MKIGNIFATDNTKTLFSVAYEGDEMEFKRLFNFWLDLVQLDDFFTEHEDDLQSGFWGDINIDKAIEKTRAEAIILRKTFNDILNDTSGNRKLQELFRTLNDNDYKPSTLGKEKSKKGWLRIYAIRINENTYVVSGGAIKLTKTMNERPHLLLELQKLELTKQFLKEHGLVDELDFGFFEFYQTEQ